MDSIDLLKIIIALVSAESSSIYINAVTDKDDRDLESDIANRSMVLLIRTIILLFSIKYKWPLEMCATISLIISIIVIIAKTKIKI
jgi:hypothetical protein